ncbi:MAG: biosynthetic-type acetolactate synthase large subunit [Planctomycetes bacterium]|nr:biosynthetic-type acetolactate synthase large subunit [Planctomycetota bacterium]
MTTARSQSSLDTRIDSLAAAPKTDKYVGLKGAEIFHQLMAEHQVEVMFGYPGGAILPVFDAIHNSPHFKFILTRHEQGAGHMAEGYARVTGKPGIVLVTSGPGATNVVTAMQDALMDGTPLIVFTGQVATAAIGSDAFQEADVTGITRSCTKWNVLVKDVRDLPRYINQAFHIATTGRPGPVLVDLPKDVTAATLREPVVAEPHMPGYHVRELGTSDEIQRVADMINGSKRPVFYVGQGVIQAGGSEVLRACALAGDIPTTTTLQGLGAFDESHPLSLHMLGMHGSAYANWAMQKADCLIAVGARFDDRITGRLSGFAPEAKKAHAEGRGGIIHFDIAPEQIGKNVPVSIGVEGDARKNLELLLPLIQKRDRSEWLAQINEWKRKYPFRYKPDNRPGHMKPQQVIEELYRQTNGEAIIATGVGQHQMWAAQFYKYKYPRHWITSGGLGTMGYGVPASIGAKLAVMVEAEKRGGKNPIVVDIDGDGSFCMTAMEMATAAQYGIGAKILILNNDFQGMVKQWQDLFYQERYSHTEMHNPDFKLLAEAMHCKGVRCESAADLPAKMKEFLEADGPVVGDFLVEKHEHVWPMVPAGATLDEMQLGVIGELAGD